MQAGAVSFCWVNDNDNDHVILATSELEYSEGNLDIDHLILLNATIYKWLIKNDGWPKGCKRMQNETAC